MVLEPIVPIFSTGKCRKRADNREDRKYNCNFESKVTLIATGSFQNQKLNGFNSLSRLRGSDVNII